ncbi:MAG TPA: asparagine synthase (glutamine-hydrolyzing) [Gemmatimonadales bacterium]|nr:asparagine synthase (glutamine-hydrolyzing) [Gemmatimonadales bacterium]
MCGICGIVLPDGSSRRLDRELLVRMRDQLVHRGPDGAGEFLDHGVALGHRRLSIVDVAHGAQPMAAASGAVQIVYNGEVYNHPELMPALQAEGVRYATHCDTETVLHLYLRHGVRTPEQLRGMFAFAIWDARTRELFIARDRLGVKPLYYVHTEDGALYFASEIKSLLAAGAVGAELNRRAFPDYLANHAPSGEDTLFKGVKRLLPGHTLTWKEGRVVTRPYWDLSFAAPTETRSDAELVAEYAERFGEAVRLRLMADVPLGMFLSGGIDSAAITATMATLVQDPIKTFSVAFREREANELYYARLVAERYRTDHHEILVSPEEFWGALPSLIWHEDEPLAHPSSVALNFVSRLAARHVKVVLTGEGSDETLAGYGRYRTTVMNLAVSRRWQSLAPGVVQRAVRAGLDTLPRTSRLRQRLMRTGLALHADLDTLYFDNFAVFGRARQRAMLSPELQAELGGLDPYATAHEAIDRGDATTLLNQLLYADIKTYLHELLMKQDQMSMAASIESRVPFLDHPLVEFTARLPARLKLRGRTTKWILRQAMKEKLPAEILSRSKMGFPVPVGAWLKGAFRPLLDQYVLSERALQRGLFQPEALRHLVAEHVAGEANHDERLWALINLEIWQRLYLDGETPNELMVGEPGATLAGTAP